MRSRRGSSSCRPSRSFSLVTEPSESPSLSRSRGSEASSCSSSSFSRPCARPPSIVPVVFHQACRVRSTVTPALIVPTVALVSAAGAGVGVAVLPPLASIAVIVALVGALSFAFGRAALAFDLPRTPQLERSAPAQTLAVTSDESSDAFRLPRLLYYVGVVLLGLLTLRVGGQVTFSDTLFLFSFLLACAELVLVRRRVPIGIPALLLLGMGMFSLGGLVSTFEAYEPIKSGAVILRLIFLTVFWFWLGVVVLKRREHVRRATTLWVLSAAITGAAALLQLAAGDVIPNTTPIYGRSTGFTNHPNELGGITAVALVPALMLATRAALPPLRRVSAFVVVLMVGGGLIASGSVGALLAAGVATFVWLALERISFHTWLLFAGAMLCVVGLVALQHTRGAPTPLDRVISVTTPSGAATAGGRQRVARLPRLDLPRRSVPDRRRPLRRRRSRPRQHHEAVRDRELRIRRSQFRHRNLVQSWAVRGRGDTCRVVRGLPGGAVRAGRVTLG